MSLYNLKTQKDGTYLITKFTEDLEVESFYSMIIMDGELNCTCPAGARPKCRHREMFHDLLPKADTNWLFDWDREEWRQYVGPLGETIDDETFEKAEAVATQTTQDIHYHAGDHPKTFTGFEQSFGSAPSGPASVADPASGVGATASPAKAPLANFKRRV